MVVLRVITPDFFLLLKDKRPFKFLDTKLDSPFLALGKHIQRLCQIESSRTKKSELSSAIQSHPKPKRQNQDYKDGRKSIFGGVGVRE
jgi:hypothetical protein